MIAHKLVAQAPLRRSIRRSGAVLPRRSRFFRRHRNIITNRSFDKLDRVLTETYPGATGETVTYSYDATAGGNPGIGHLTGFSDESGSSALFYDIRGNIAQRSQTIGTKGYVTGYAYDLGDKPTLITYPSGRQVQYTYSSAGYLTAVNTRATSTGSWTAVAGAITHEPFGPTKGFTYGNGLVATRTWNQNYWPLSIKTGPTSSSSTIQNLSLGYDYAGNINALTDTLTPSRTQSFTLDALNRISQATGTYGTVNYTYDDNGNRKTRVTGGVTQTYTSSTTSNRLSKVADGTTTRNFSYTGAGDLSSDDRGTSPDLTFSYNHRGRMSSLKTAGVTTATYKTDAWGERASKTLASGPVTHYLYDTQGHLLEEADGTTGAAIRDTIWLPDNVGPDLPIGQADASGTIIYLHDDQLGTPQKITDATQAVVWDRTQQPFGEDAGTTGSTPTSLRFPGQSYDAEDALHYNLMRDYDPSIGRYIQYDPIGLDGGWNPYAYVSGNPLRYTDMKGTAYADTLRGILSNIYQSQGESTEDANRQARSTLAPYFPESCPIPDGNILNAEISKEPGRPTEADGFKPPKRPVGNDGIVKNPNGPGKGYVDDNGKVWVPTGTAGAPGTGTTGPAHGGPHWDVQDPITGGSVNVLPGGRVR